MSTDVIDKQVAYISGAGEKCGVCLREDAFAIGRMSGVTLTTGVRHSAAVCSDCVLIILTGRWELLESLVFGYQAQDWTAWEAITHRHRARRVARSVARFNARLFADITPEPSARTNDHAPNRANEGGKP